MTTRGTRLAAALILACSLLMPWPASAADQEIEALKRQVEQLMNRVNELERERATAEPAAAPAAAPASVPEAEEEPTAEAPVAQKPVGGKASPVTARESFRDEQQAAPRPDDYMLDPKMQGFMRIANTRALIKFNAKPRVDGTYDNRNSGDENRFVTARIPVDGDIDEGGDGVFNINAKGSQLRLDVRAPEVAGNPRFYYENDFYGSGGGEFPYRVRHLYGQIYNVIVGQTYSIFEDPDAWPDTVDYEGPNAAIFARRPLIRYQHRFDDQWQLNLGIEQPEAEVDLAGLDPDASSRNEAPDGGFNVRWEGADVGHVQFASIFRDIGVDGPIVGDQNVFGWGVNLSAVINTFGRDSLQWQSTYGEGIFRYMNDDFQNTDASFDDDGDLEALETLALMFGYTHHWDENFRSSLSYGYVNVDNSSGQEDDAYHMTHYGSFNVVWQLRRRLAVGLEELYGFNEQNDGDDGDVWRTQLSLMYSIFD